MKPIIENVPGQGARNFGAFSRPFNHYRCHELRKLARGKNAKPRVGFAVFVCLGGSRLTTDLGGKVKEGVAGSARRAGLYHSLSDPLDVFLVQLEIGTAGVFGN